MTTMATTTMTMATTMVTTAMPTVYRQQAAPFEWQRLRGKNNHADKQSCTQLYHHFKYVEMLIRVHSELSLPAEDAFFFRFWFRSHTLIGSVGYRSLKLISVSRL